MTDTAGTSSAPDADLPGETGTAEPAATVGDGGAGEPDEASSDTLTDAIDDGDAGPDGGQSTTGDDEKPRTESSSESPTGAGLGESPAVDAAAANETPREERLGTTGDVSVGDEGDVNVGGAGADTGTDD